MNPAGVESGACQHGHSHTHRLAEALIHTRFSPTSEAEGETMKVLVCTSCGSKELLADDGYLICIYCKSRHVPDAADGPPKETVIGIAADIQALLKKCVDDPVNRRRYASLILDLDPTNTEATKHLT